MATRKKRDDSEALAPTGTGPDEQLERQLTLFELIESPRPKERYSHTIDLYDGLPKYQWSRESSTEASSQVRPYTHRGVDYEMTVIPAQIIRDGNTTFVYPGVREEVVEDALRKLLTQGQGQVTGKDVSVNFTVRQLRDELSRNGRTYSHTQIVEALEICQGARLEVRTKDGRSVVRSQFFPTIALTSRSDIARDPNAMCHVRFNPLVTESIRDSSFRRYNYQLNMSLTNNLARYIHKRMSSRWLQASSEHPYNISLLSFLEASPQSVSTEMKYNVRAMKTALEALTKAEIISHYDEDRIKEGRRIIDIRYAIFPHESFVAQMIASNRHHQVNDLRAATQLLRGSAGSKQTPRKGGDSKE